MKKKYIKIQFKYISIYLKKIFSKTLRDIAICPKCNEIIPNIPNPFVCPNCKHKAGIIQKVIDIKWIIILIIILSIFSIKAINKQNTKMILVKEYKDQWTAYQFFIDNKGKKHIKIISSDLDWMQNDELSILDFSEDNIPPNLDKKYPDFFINWLKSQFNDKSNWQ